MLYFDLMFKESEDKNKNYMFKFMSLIYIMIFEEEKIFIYGFYWE